MKKILTFPVLALGMAALAHAQTPTKVAIIHVQNAILSTKEGQKAANDLNAKFAPKKSELDKKQSELTNIQDQLRKGSATMSEEVKAKLMREFDSGNKMMGVIEKYATQNGIALVVDVSNPQTPVLWASQTIDITGDIVKLYDQANPGTGGPTTGAPKPGTPSTLAPKPPSQTTPTGAPPAPKKK